MGGNVFHTYSWLLMVKCIFHLSCPLNLQCPFLAVSAHYSICSLLCPLITVSVPCCVRSLQCPFLAVSRWRRWWRWFCRSVTTWTEEPSADRRMGTTWASSPNYATSSPWYVERPYLEWPCIRDPSWRLQPWNPHQTVGGENPWLTYLATVSLSSQYV